jgi:dienelactone hydrolase
VPSKVSDIYRYAEELNATGKYFELKVYQGEPHGFTKSCFTFAFFHSSLCALCLCGENVVSRWL